MNWRYAYRHWGFTILLAPLVFIILLNISNRHPASVGGTIDLYFSMLAFSGPVSIPVFIIYLFICALIDRDSIHSLLKKIILIGWSIAGIVVTLRILDPLITSTLIIIYSATAFLMGILLKIRKPSTEVQRFKITKQ